MIDQKINLGVDLDGCVCNLWDPFCVEVLNRYDIILPSDIPEYNVEECTELTKKQVETIFKKGRQLYRNLTAIKGAKFALNKLQKKYFIHIITHRDFYKGIQADTINWLRKNDIPYDDITFTNSDKLKSVLKAKCKYMIENCGETALQLAENGQKVLLLDYSYNKNFHHKLITRVNNWSEILEILK